MNKRWIQDSHKEANLRRKYILKNKELLRFDRIDYLDIMGLFETCWITVARRRYDKNRYGYPNE